MKDIHNCELCNIAYIHTENENILVNEKFIDRDNKNPFSIYYVYFDTTSLQGKNICIDCLTKGLLEGTIEEHRGDFYIVESKEYKLQSISDFLEKNGLLELSNKIIDVIFNDINNN